MSRRGLIDLHCHPVPGVDDGVRTAQEGAELLAGLCEIGFDRVVATPHIRSGFWENRRATLVEPLAALRAAMVDLDAKGTRLPALDMAAEHMFDDVGWELFDKGEALQYPGGRAALVEFQYDSIPLRVELRLWRLCKRGVTPVLAHPERYAPLYASSDRLEELVGAGAKPLLDVMSLVGRYGARSQSAAERILREGHYVAACTDAHKPSDVEVVSEAITALERRVGLDGARRLLMDAPRSLLGE